MKRRQPDGMVDVVVNWSIAVLIGLLCAGGAAHAQTLEKIYWFQDSGDTWGRCSLDGSANQRLFSSMRVGFGIAIDEATGTVYWTSYWDDRIRSCDLDGGGIATLLCAGADDPQALALDTVSGRMYWIDEGTGSIRSAALDGSDLQVVQEALAEPRGIAVDPAAGKVYWTDRTDQALRRCNLDGSDAETLIDTGLTAPTAIALDTAAGMVYLVDAQTLLRGPIDGSGLAEIVPLVGADSGIALDVAAGKIYWHGSGVQRSNLDGSMVEDVVDPDADGGFGLAVSVTSGSLYIADRFRGIKRSALVSAPGFDLIIDVDFPSIRGMAVDPVTATMFWTRNDAIWRAGIDGTALGTIATGLTSPWYIAVDPAGEKVYWASLTSDVIQRSDLDGGGLETLPIPLNGAGPLAVDAAAGTLYWIDSGVTDFIRRGNLDGTAIETLVTFSQVFLRDLAVDPASGRLFWTDPGDDRIRWAPIDGGAALDLITGLDGPDEIEVNDGRIYWREAGGVFRRANTDGTNVEPLITTGATKMALGPGPSADLDGSGAIDKADLMMLLGAWGPCPCDAPCADLDGDGATGTADLLALLAAWSQQ